MLCDKCRQAGEHRFAHYVLLADSEDLVGQKPEEASDENMAFLQWSRLCRPHHAELPEDARMAYVPTAYGCSNL